MWHGHADLNVAEIGLSHHPLLSAAFVQKHLKEDWNFEALLCAAFSDEVDNLADGDHFDCTQLLSFKLRPYFKMRIDFLQHMRAVVPLIRLQRKFKELHYAPGGRYETIGAQRFDEAAVLLTLLN